MRRRSDMLTLISVYQFACGLGNLLVMCGCLSLPFIVAAATASSSARDGATATAIVAVASLFGSAIFFVLAAANVAAAWGLWEQREWGRVLTIVLSVIRLLNFPLGTVIGGLIIWYLLAEQGRTEFAAA